MNGDDPKPLRRSTDRTSQTVTVAVAGILAVAMIAIVAITLGQMGDGALVACLMAIREAIGSVARRYEARGPQP